MPKKLDTSPYKGVRDFYPQDKFVQNYIFSVWHRVAESFGYEEYDASILEPSEIFKEKSGEEIVNEQTFTFTDRGGREVTLRPEITPTLARMVAALRRELGFPLRLYSIPNLFRYEATQRGRLREHWQLNVDIIGASILQADIETILVADKIMKEFGAKSQDYEIRLNDPAKGANIDQLIGALKDNGITNIKIDDTLARGQTYYTGIVYEFFDTSSENPRSLLGGGRYDNLTSMFGDSSNLGFVGFGAGDVTIKDFLQTHNLLPTYESRTRLYIAITDISLSQEVINFALNLQSKGVNTAIDWSERKVGDQIKNAAKHGVKFATVFGSEESEKKEFRIKNLDTGEEKTLKEQEIPDFLKASL